MQICATKRPNPFAKSRTSVINKLCVCVRFFVEKTVNPSFFSSSLLGSFVIQESCEKGGEEKKKRLKIPRYHRSSGPRQMADGIYECFELSGVV